MIVILTGPMGCGKTTIGRLLATRLGWRFADGDDYHPSANIAKMKKGIPLEDGDRLPWLAIIRTMILQCLEEQENLVLACSALKKKYRKQLGINQQDIISVYLQGSPELLEQRVARRCHVYMKKSLLASQIATLEEPQSGLIVDIDAEPQEIVAEIIKKLSTYLQSGTNDEA